MERAPSLQHSAHEAEPILVLTRRAGAGFLLASDHALNRTCVTANSKVLSIFYGQSFRPEGWVPTNTTPNTSLSPSELAQWVEDLAYDAWLRLPVNKMELSNILEQVVAQRYELPCFAVLLTY